MKAANAAIFVPHRGCPHQCAFCDQRGISGAADMPSTEEIRATLTKARESLGERVRSSMIAFFGGSFTAIDREEMTALLEAAQPFLGEGGFAGIRVSTRPDAVDAETLGLLRNFGVWAVELGAQSMDDRALRACGRGHTARQVMEASAMIREAGLSLGLQMMTGLPLDSDSGAKATLEALLALRPDTLRIYPTLVLRGTELARLWRDGAYEPQTLEGATELCSGLLERCRERNVPVIRVGLHDEGSLRENLLSGPYHPAFRELCEGRALLKKALRLLEKIPPGPVTLLVGVGSVSRMVGHGGCNRRLLEEMGYRIRVREAPKLGCLEVKAAPDNGNGST